MSIVSVVAVVVVVVVVAAAAAAAAAAVVVVVVVAKMSTATRRTHQISVQTRSTHDDAKSCIFEMQYRHYSRC